jgi:TonB family protein
MRKLIFYFIVILFSSKLFGQIEPTRPLKYIANTSTFVEELPYFENSSEFKILKNFINSNLIYPESAKENCIQGNVVVAFFVEPNGIIDSINIEHSLNEECDIEAIRLIKLTSDKWIPGKQNGNNIRVRMMVPILFENKIGCKSVDDYNRTANVKYKNRMFSEALNDFKEVLNFRLNDAEVLFKIAVCYIELNKKNEACKILELIDGEDVKVLKRKECN